MSASDPTHTDSTAPPPATAPTRSETYDWGIELPRIESERAVLRQLDDEDVDDLFDIFGDEEVTRFWSSPPYRERSEAEALLDEICNCFDERSLFQWGVARRDDDRVVGTVTLWQLDPQNRRGEVGFALGRPAWGQGLMSEVLTAFFAFCFGADGLGLHRLEADVEPANERSLRLLGRLGFEREGYLKERWWTYGKPQDSVILGLLARQWATRRGAEAADGG